MTTQTQGTPQSAESGVTILCTYLAFTFVAAGTGLVLAGPAGVLAAGLFGMFSGILAAPLLAFGWMIVRHYTGESLLTAVLYGGILCGGLVVLFGGGDAKFDEVMWFAFMGVAGGTIYASLMTLFRKGT